jgi:hypothetical protein
VKPRCWRRRERRSGGGRGKFGEGWGFLRGGNAPHGGWRGSLEEGRVFGPGRTGDLSGRLFADTIESVFGADVQRIAGDSDG